MDTSFSTVARRTDSYKVSHHRQYPPGTENIYSYLESRAGAKFDVTTFFGLQYILKEYFAGVRVTQRDIIRDRSFFKAHFFGNDNLHNRDGWDRILNRHGGKLPLRIKAVPEGTVVNNLNVLMTVETLDENLPWLTNYAETVLMHVWSPSTVCTGSRNSKMVIADALELSGTLDPGIRFKLHDFGFRGVSSVETAALAGAAHLVNFSGTDTMAACDLVLEYYSGKTREEIDQMSNEEYEEFVQANMAGFSIPASEHSTMTSWGEDGEVDAFRNMLKQYPSGPVACVSDSWDIDRACSELWPSMKDQILSRDGFLVVRPDSGEPTDVVPRILGHLCNAFGYTINSKGYKVLPDQLRVIQGDGIDYDSISDIINAVMDAGFSMDNLAFGSGGGLLQKVNRDTQSQAIKCSEALINGEAVEVFKRPATDPNKNSKRGRLALVKNADNTYSTVSEQDCIAHNWENNLQTVFENGEIVNEQLFSDIVRRAEIPHMLNASGANA